MRDMIAMLDGFGGVEQTVQPSDGQNHVGGATWFPGSPAPSGGGLAGRMQMRGYSVEIHGDPTVQPSGSQANHVGGATWFPGAPTYASSGGLAALDGDLANYLGGDDRGYESYGLARLANTEMTTSPSGGQNHAGGGTWFPGAPTDPSGTWGLAALARFTEAGDPISRVTANVISLLQQYGTRCAIASDRILQANTEAARYQDWMRNGFGDPGLRRRAQLTILRVLAKGLQSVVVDCGTRGPMAVSRTAIAMAYRLTGEPTNR
jgi:hypothetical protein